MIERVNPEMIVLAREVRGVNQATLAKLIGVNQATVSRYEAGTLEVAPSHLESMAAALERPLSFFYWKEKLYDSSCLYHRKNARIPVHDLKCVHASVNILRTPGCVTSSFQGNKAPAWRTSGMHLTKYSMALITAEIITPRTRLAAPSVLPRLRIDSTIATFPAN